jgi:hypothetical protein
MLSGIAVAVCTNPERDGIPRRHTRFYAPNARYGSRPADRSSI